MEIFTYTLNLLKKLWLYIMGLITKRGVDSTKQKPAPTPKPDEKPKEEVVPKKDDPSMVLTADEYEFLFDILRDADFKGSQVQDLYNIIMKLQKQYLNLKN